MITITSKDALRSKQLTPGWREGACISYMPKTAATDGSVNHIWELEVQDGGLTVPIKSYLVSEKAISMGKNFFIACGFPQEAWNELETGKVSSSPLDPIDCVNKKFKIFVSNKTFDGKIQNEATDFLPLI